MELIAKTKAEKVIWNHTDFNFRIPDTLNPWIKNNINLPAEKLGMKKIGFIPGNDVLAQ